MDRIPKHWVKFIGGRPPTFEELYRVIRSNLEEYFNLVKLSNPRRSYVKRLMYYASGSATITHLSLFDFSANILKFLLPFVKNSFIAKIASEALRPLVICKYDTA